MKAEIEILIISGLYIAIATLLFNYIHNYCLTKVKTAFYFIFPMWCLFLGFYYWRCFIDENYDVEYWRVFMVFETITKLFFLVFIYLIKKKSNYGKV